MVSALDSTLTSSIYSEKETAALFSDEAEINSLLKFEKELAMAQEELGIIPAGIGQKIFSSLDGFKISPASLAEGYAKDGIPIPALLKILKNELEEETANYLHFGATSQDALDTGLIIRVKAAIDVITRNFDRLIDELVSLASIHKTTVMIGRTRNQNGAPITFGLKIVNWIEPLKRQRRRLTELVPRLLVIQLGGSVGTNAALAPKGEEVAGKLAQALGLSLPVSPWHAQRDSIIEFANWLSMTAGQVGKIGKDLMLLAQNEIGEITFNNPGKSSTMPNKANPVLCETLVSLAAFCRSNADLIEQTALISHERDGVCMTIERLAFPTLVCAASASIVQAKTCLENMSVNMEAIQKNINADRGLFMAEAAVFALMKFTTRKQASELVSQACESCISNQSHMIDELKSLSSFNLDWESLRAPQNYLGNAQKIVEKAVNDDAHD